MNEAARLLRLLAPGTLFLLLYGVWFVLDSNLCNRSLPQVSGGAVALVGGAAIPIGFVAQMVAAEITWLRCLQGRRWRPFLTINNRKVAQQIRAIGEGEPDLDLVGIVDVWIHEAYADTKHAHTLNRMRSVADLYQGLAHGSVVSAMAGLVAVATVFATSCWPGDEPLGSPRIALLGVCVVVCAVLSWRMCTSHRRVVGIAETMVREILTRKRQSLSPDPPIEA